MLGCWRSSWARSAPAAVGECPPGGRRRRLLLGAALRPPCPRACSPASRAAQVHVRALLTTQCFQHCQFLLAHRLSHFEKVLGEPRFTTWATLAAHLCLVVAGVRAAGISVARQPSARTLQPHRAPRGHGRGALGGPARAPGLGLPCARGQIGTSASTSGAHDSVGAAYERALLATEEKSQPGGPGKYMKLGRVSVHFGKIVPFSVAVKVPRLEGSATRVCTAGTQSASQLPKLLTNFP